MGCGDWLMDHGQMIGLKKRSEAVGRTHQTVCFEQDGLCHLKSVSRKIVRVLAAARVISPSSNSSEEAIRHAARLRH